MGRNVYKEKNKKLLKMLVDSRGKHDVLRHVDDLRFIVAKESYCFKKANLISITFDTIILFFNGKIQI